MLCRHLPEKISGDTHTRTHGYVHGLAWASRVPTYSGSSSILREGWGSLGGKMNFPVSVLIPVVGISCQFMALIETPELGERILEDGC